MWKLNYTYGEIELNGNLDVNKNTGNIARMTTSFAGLSQSFVQSFKYDSLYRLKEAKEMQNDQQTWIQGFDYDRYGNRIAFNQNITGIAYGQITQTPAIDPQKNRFTSGNYSYDFNGNIVKDLSDNNQIRDFTFNGDNKQTEIKIGNATIGRYFYDGEGKRVKKVTNHEETIFVYDGSGKLIAEYSTDISPTPQTKYLTEDHLGTPRIITDATGQITARRDLLPFGEDLPAGVGSRSAAQKYGATDDIRQKFTGYQKDKETSLDFAEARMYENRFGRFTAVDPLLASGKSANPQTFNRYVYTSNNPIIRVDRNGKIWIRSKTKDKNGLYTYRDETGKTLEKYLSSGGYERVKFNGKYSDIMLNENPVYRMFAKGGGVELSQKPKENTGGMNDNAVAFGKGFGKNYEANMALLGAFQAFSASIVAMPYAFSYAVGGGSSSLVHFTSGSSFSSISSSGSIIGRNGIFALEQGAVNQSVATQFLRTLVSPDKLTHFVKIPESAAQSFYRVVPVGPYSLLKNLSGTYFSAPGTVNLTTGTFTSTGTVLRSAASFYAPDAAIYGGVGSFFFYQNRETTPQPAPQPAPQPSPLRSQ